MLPVPLVVPRCEQVADHLSEFLDGELASRPEACVRIHLAVCAGCARFAAELAATVEALHALRARRPRARG
jgi:predicted anti-sigma-YlaC factor YlaD